MLGARDTGANTSSLPPSGESICPTMDRSCTRSCCCFLLNGLPAKDGSKRLLKPAPRLIAARCCSSTSSCCRRTSCLLAVACRSKFESSCCWSFPSVGTQWHCSNIKFDPPWSLQKSLKIASNGITDPFNSNRAVRKSEFLSSSTDGASPKNHACFTFIAKGNCLVTFNERCVIVV